MMDILVIFAELFIVSTVVFMFAFKVYKGILRFATVVDFVRVTVSVFSASVFSTVVAQAIEIFREKAIGGVLFERLN